MELMKFLSVFATFCLMGPCVAQQASGRSPLQPHSMPAYMLQGNDNGEIRRCPIHDPTKCELIYIAPSAVLDTLVHGEHFYASLKNGVILKCHWYENQLCTVFHQTYESVYSLIATGYHLYAGLRMNVICCDLNVLNSCAIAHTFKDVIWGTYEHDKYVYIVTSHDFFRCSKETKFKCVLLATRDDEEAIAAVSGWGDSILTISWIGQMTTYNATSNTMLPTETVLGYFCDMAVFKGIVYVVDTSGDFGDIKTCKWNKPTRCTKFIHHQGVTSISFAYETYSVQLPHPDVLCGLQSNPGSVFEYGPEHRAQLEVHVSDGKLVDARGALVDTRSADVGYSGRAAVFAMGPGGRILVSHAHRSGLVHITSLFAGSPAAGAGEMHVEDGVIKRIVACSESYRADVELNRQVVHELYSRGYTRGEEIQLEECAYTCDKY